MKIQTEYKETAGMNYRLFVFKQILWVTAEIPPCQIPC